MVRSKFGLKGLGLCALVLGIMAFGSTAAQAEVGASWSVKNTKGELFLIPGANDLLPTLEGEIETGGASLLATIAGVPTKISCTGGTLIGIKLEANGSLTNGGKVSFTGCETYLNGVKSGPCKPSSTGTAPGTILTNAGKGLLLLHKLVSGGVVDDIVHLKPSTGTIFVTILLGEECSIGEEIPVAGELAIQDCEGLALEYRVTHLIIEFKDLTKLTALGNPATLDGSANIRLSGAHAGFTWLGKPA